MTEREKLLQSLGLNVSDGQDLDSKDRAEFLASEADRRLVEDLQSLSLIADFYRTSRSDAQKYPLGDNNQPAPKQWAHLSILERIGRGSSGAIYRAHDTELKRDVALKLINDTDLDKSLQPALREGEHLAKVRHPNLVTVYGAAHREGIFGLWMEHLSGSTLHDQIQNQGPQSAGESVLIGADLCGAMAALHKAGLLHRDIKAQNVIREEGGRIVLMDLGAGTVLSADDLESPDVQTGTPLYMAPELLAGGTATPQSDIYSLGVLLYYSVTGCYPVQAKTLGELKQKHLQGERRHLRDERADLSPEFIQVIERAIAPDPGERYSSAGEMESALMASTGDRNKRPKTRRLPLYTILAAATTIIAVILFLWPGLITGGDYTVEATLLRVESGGANALLPGSRVAPGDELYLQFEASQSMHLYVLAEDDRGEAYLLFPIPGQEARNPLPGNINHRLPPAKEGRLFNWGVSSAGGTEHFIIVASPEALTEFETAIAGLPSPRQAGAPSAIHLDRNSLSGLRGIGLLTEATNQDNTDTGRAAFAMARSLTAGAEQSRGIWVRQIDLINPAP